MSNLLDEDKIRSMKPTDHVLGVDEDGCLINILPTDFSGSIPIDIDTETGEGEEIFTEQYLNGFLFKKIKSSDGSADVTTDIDGNIDVTVNFPEAGEVDFPVTESQDLGDGISLRGDVANKKIGISTLRSDDLSITKELDGSVKINSSAGFLKSVSVVSSNPMQSVAVGADGATSFDLSYLVSIDVYNGSTQLIATNNNTLAADQYRIELPPSPRAGITVTKENSSTLKYRIASGTVFTGNSVLSNIQVKVGLSNTPFSSSFLIAPITTAEDSTSLTLSVDSFVAKFDSSDTLVYPESITASVIQQNYNEAITWTSVPVGLVTGNGLTKVLNTAAIFQNGVTSLKIRVSTPNGLSDEITIVKVKDGDTGAPGTPGTPGAPGAPGIQGTTGAIPRLLEFVNGGEYENGGEFIDYAYYRSNDANEGWYTVNVVGGVKTVATYSGGVPSPTIWTKKAFQKEMSFGTVIAEQANLAGFIFRNQVLNSQQGTPVAECHPYYGTPQAVPSNLSLDGLNAIIKFLDKMILDPSGLTFKDSCGNKRMSFQQDATGTPSLKFFEADGQTVSWEAGKGGYKVVYIPTAPESWNIVTVDKTKKRTITPTGSNLEFSDVSSYFCEESAEPGRYNASLPQPINMPYIYDKGVQADDYPWTNDQLQNDDKTFKSNSFASGLIEDGWYPGGFAVKPYTGYSKAVVVWNQFVNGYKVDERQFEYDVEGVVGLC